MQITRSDALKLVTRSTLRVAARRQPSLKPLSRTRKPSRNRRPHCAPRLHLPAPPRKTRAEAPRVTRVSGVATPGLRRSRRLRGCNAELHFNFIGSVRLLCVRVRVRVRVVGCPFAVRETAPIETAAGSSLYAKRNADHARDNFIHSQHTQLQLLRDSFFSIVPKRDRGEKYS
jgi:hypothetical protein